MCHAQLVQQMNIGGEDPFLPVQGYQPVVRHGAVNAGAYRIQNGRLARQVTEGLVQQRRVGEVNLPVRQRRYRPTYRLIHRRLSPGLQRRRCRGHQRASPCRLPVRLGIKPDVLHLLQPLHHQGRRVAGHLGLAGIERLHITGFQGGVLAHRVTDAVATFGKGANHRLHALKLPHAVRPNVLHRMGMQLRVKVARRIVIEHRHHQVAGQPGFRNAGGHTARRGQFLHLAQCHLHGTVVRRHQTFVAAGQRHDGHAFGRGKRQVIPGTMGIAPVLHPRQVAAVRQPALEHRNKVRQLHRPRQPQRLGTLPDPALVHAAQHVVVILMGIVITCLAGRSHLTDAHHRCNASQGSLSSTARP